MTRINKDSNNQEIYSLYVHKFPNNKVYVGITKYIPKYRWGKDGNGYEGQVVYKAIQKYGWGNIKHEILLETTDKKVIEEKERYYITEVYHSDLIEFGYNIERGGRYAGKISEEMKQHLRKLNLGKKQSPETIRKKSLAAKGRKVSLETRKRQSIAAKGRIFTEQHRINLSKSLTGKPSPKRGTGMPKEEKVKKHRACCKTYYAKNKEKIAERHRLKMLDPMYKAAFNQKRRERRLLLKNINS